MEYIDTHCHLDDEKYQADFGEVMGRMKEKKVGAITIGTNLEDSKKAVQIANENEQARLPTPEAAGNGGQVWACIGVHPNYEEEFNEEEFEKLVQSAGGRSKVVGIGECGLDFFRTEPENLEKEKERQEKLFRKQIEFALKHDKPLMLHCRAAYDETLNILESYKEEAGKKLRGSSHFFAGNVEQAKRFVDLGFSCSFTGVVTFSRDYDEVIKSLPQDKIMSETDAPWVAPVPYRGKRNEPSFVVQVAHKLAEIRGEDPEKFKKILVDNAEKLFGLVV